MSLQPMSYPFKALAARLPEGVLSDIRIFDQSGDYGQLTECILFIETTCKSFEDLAADEFPDAEFHIYLMERGEEALNWLLNFIGREERITPQAQRALNEMALWLDELDHLLRGSFKMRHWAAA